MRRLVIILALFFFVMLSSAHAGDVVGFITDESDEPLAGANVLLDGTSLGAATDIEGFFRIKSVPPGEYTVIVNYIGYTSFQSTLTVQDAARTEFNAQLRLETLEGETITVEGNLEGQLAAINQQLTSNTIVNVVSAERIRELPDDNAAESVARLPGVAVRRSGGEASRVNIRGMAPAYNSISVDGERIPATSQGRTLFRFKAAGGGDISTTTDDRSVDLSVISAEALSGIEVFKALTPDKDADAIGGMVNFRTGKARSGLKARVNLLGAYTGYHNSFDNYHINFSVSDRFLDDNLGLLVSGGYQHVDRSSHQQEADWILRGSALQLRGVDLDDRIEFRDRYQANLNLDYDIADHTDLIWTNFYSRTDREIRNRAVDWSLLSNSGSYSANWSKPSIYVYSSHLRGEHQVPIFDIDWGFNYITTVDENDFNYGWGFSEEAVFQSTDFIENEGPYAASNYASFDPNRARGGTPWGGGVTKRQDQNWSAQLNLQAPFSLLPSLGGNVKFGGKIRSKDRSFEQEGLKGRGVNFFNAYIADNPDAIVVQSALAYSNFDGAYDPGEFYNGDHFFPTSLDYEMPKKLFDQYRSIWKDQIADGLNDYNAKEQITAGYTMIELNYKQRLVFTGGARYEHINNDYTAIWRTDITENYPDETPADIQGIWRDTTSETSSDEWFPQFHLKYSVFQDRGAGTGFDVRLAYTRTIARPNFVLISPRLHISQSASTTFRGNPDLKPTTSWNYDLFLTYYSRWGLFTIGGFYKDLDNVSFEYQRQAGENDDVITTFIVDPLNSNEDNFVYGYELEIQTNLTWLPNPFDGIVLYGNYSRIISEVKYPWTFFDITKIEPPLYQPARIDSFRVNKLPGQADHLVNLSLGYDKGSFTSRLSFYYQSKTLQFIGENDLTDGWADQYLRVDFNASYRITDNWLVLLNMQNLTNRRDRTFRGIENRVMSESIFGSRIELGIRYDLL